MPDIIGITHENSDQLSLSEQYPDLEPRMINSQYGEIMYDEDGSDRDLPKGHPSAINLYSFFAGLCDVRKVMPSVTGQAEDWARMINVANRDKKDRLQINAGTVNNILKLADIKDRDWLLILNIVRLPIKGGKPGWFDVARRLGARPLPGISWVSVPSLQQPKPTGDPLHDRAAMDGWRQRELMNQMRGLPKMAREAIEQDNALSELTAQAHGVTSERLVHTEDKLKIAETTVKEQLALITGIKRNTVTN